MDRTDSTASNLEEENEALRRRLRSLERKDREHSHGVDQESASHQTINFQIDVDSIAEYLTSFTEMPPFKPSSDFLVSVKGESGDDIGEHKVSPMRFKFHSFGAESLSSRTFEPLPLNRHNLQARLRLAPFWLDVLNPSAEEMSALARVFKLHPLTMEDILTGTREKCETFPGYSFVSFTTFEADEESAGFLQAIPVYMVIFRECLLSFHMKPMTHMQHVLRRVEQLSLSGPQLSPDWLNYALIDNVIDAFMPLIEHIEQEVEAIDDLVLVLKGNEQSDMLRRISTARKRVNQLLRLLAPKTDTIRALIKRCSTRLSRESDIILYLEDVQDHIITMNLNLTHCEKTLMRTHSNYLADISIAITNSSNQTNDIVLKMTTIASLLVPLNLITGLWGMNVPVPGRDEEGLTWFFSLVTAMVVIALSAYLVARKYKIF